MGISISSRVIFSSICPNWFLMSGLRQRRPSSFRNYDQDHIVGTEVISDIATEELNSSQPFVGRMQQMMILKSTLTCWLRNYGWFPWKRSLPVSTQFHGLILSLFNGREENVYVKCSSLTQNVNLLEIDVEFSVWTEDLIVPWRGDRLTLLWNRTL